MESSVRLGALALGILGATPELLPGILARLGHPQHHQGPAQRALRHNIRVSSLLRLIRTSPMHQPGRGQLLAIPPTRDKLLLQSRHLPVEQEIRLVDKAD